MYLFLGCRQTLCPCCTEEGWYWSQQKGWRADWGGGEESYLWPELRTNSLLPGGLMLTSTQIWSTWHNSHWAICSVARWWNKVANSPRDFLYLIAVRKTPKLWQANTNLRDNLAQPRLLEKMSWNIWWRVFVSSGRACGDHHAESSPVQNPRLVPQQTEGCQRWEIQPGGWPVYLTTIL